MARGRPISGVDLIERLDAPRALRRRMRVVLATLAGELPIAEACAQLRIGRSRFHALRWQMLVGALDAVRPLAAWNASIASGYCPFILSAQP